MASENSAVVPKLTLPPQLSVLAYREIKYYFAPPVYLCWDALRSIPSEGRRASAASLYSIYIVGPVLSTKG